MKRHVGWVAALTMAGMLSGCATYSLEELRRTTPQGTPFQKALAMAYMEFADSEEKQYDWIDSMHFADKGLMSAYGKTVNPEDPKAWNIPESALGELQVAHTALVAALTSPAMNTQPEMLARAQAYFDCWVEQQEENWQEEDIAGCRDGFKDALASVSGGAPLSGMPSAAAPVVIPEEAGAEIVMPDAVAPARVMPDVARSTPTEAYVVFFEKGETDLTASGRNVIDEVTQKLETVTIVYEVVLNSYTDTVGDAKANLKLTEQRAQAVKQRLMDGGVKEDDIRIFAFGESDPPVKTGDNVDEPANRRVEIFISE